MRDDDQVTLNAMRLRVECVDGATVVELRSNLTLEAVGNMPPMSLGFVVKGGGDQAVAEAILGIMPPHIETFGELLTWCDVRGHSRHIRFSRPFDDLSNPWEDA